MIDSLVFWDSKSRETIATAEEIDYFDARGMHLMYGRGDNFGRHHTFHMDIWMRRDGRLLMRCWSRCLDIDSRSFEIKGVHPSEILEIDKKKGFIDLWVPRAVRNAYEEWIQE